MNELELLREILPLLVPILIIQLGLMAIALVDLTKRQRTRGPRWMWALIIILVNLLGPILYFAFGREER